ncbi:tetratricopeptide repeat protein [Niveispirillum sp.]|uniref:tetratricopeptide repeat protein n=1 Tax=Niveispirillum sp. TaxID=1917217 RepID=UPI001B5FD35D|nr:tetratricopeptide repeat protein [Niveispirillum sp.]MBP7334798.1 tetratricopeptide repeat protein [Niveispirillum sp.]
MSDISIGVGGPADQGRMAMDAGNHAEAVALLREAILDDPGDATLRADLGVALETLEDYDGAAQAYAAAAALEPDNPIYHFNQGAVAQAQGRPHDAAGHYLNALEREPLFAEAYYNLGTLFFDAGHLEIAAEHYGNALKARPDYAEAASNLGLTLRRLGRQAEAVEQFQLALRLRPDIIITHSNLGLTLAESGRYDEAIACFGQALAMDPNNSPLHINISLAWRGVGRLDMAADAALKALRLAPDSAVAQVELGAVAANLRRTGDEAALATLLDTWREIAGETAQLQHTLAALGQSPTPARAGDAFVAQTFDASAKRFDEMIGSLGYAVPEAVGAALSRHLGAGKGDKDILDAGCGTGLAAPHLAPHARTLTGVDLSLSMLQQALRRGLYSALDQAELGAYLIARPASFDVISASDVLCYFGDLEDIFRCAGNSLRPGGLLIGSVETIAGDKPYVLHEGGRYAHDPAYVRDCLTAAGLTPVELTSLVLRYEGGKPVQGLLAIAAKP